MTFSYANWTRKNLNFHLFGSPSLSTWLPLIGEFSIRSSLFIILSWLMEPLDIFSVNWVIPFCFVVRSFNFLHFQTPFLNYTNCWMYNWLGQQSRLHLTATFLVDSNIYETIVWDFHNFFKSEMVLEIVLRVFFFNDFRSSCTEVWIWLCNGVIGHFIFSSIKIWKLLLQKIET